MSNFEKLTGPPQLDEVKVTIGAEGGKYQLPMHYRR